jgi:DNA-binding transcriptional LysR family regulator
MQMKWQLLPMVFAKKNSIDWDDLRIVLAVAQDGTLSDAARSLGVTHSTVFRRLGAIERRLGVRLFERFRDGYAPTSAGETVRVLAARFAEEISALERQLSGQDLRPSGIVRVTTTDTIGAILLPLLPQLRASYPDIRADIAVSNSMADLTHREADIAIRPTPDPPHTLVGRRITDIAHAIYASPNYLSRHSRRELAGYDWIGVDDSLRSTIIGRWMHENVPNESVTCRVDALPALRDAARAGMGLALLPCYLGDAADGLQRATRKMPAVPCSALWLLTHNDLKHTARIRAAMDFLAHALRSQRPLFEGRQSQPIPRP